MDQINSNIDLVKNASSTVKRGLKNTSASTPVSVWKAELRIYGISEERREELVSNLERNLKTPRLKDKSEDGVFRFKASVAANGLGSGFACSVSQFASFMRDAGMKGNELRDNQVSLVLEPSDEQANDASGIRGKIAKKLSSLTHGLSMAADEAFDLGCKQELGGKDYDMGLIVAGGSENARKSLAKAFSGLSGASKASDGELDDRFIARIKLDNVGSSLGALGLASRELEGVLNQADPESTLRVIV